MKTATTTATALYRPPWLVLYAGGKTLYRSLCCVLVEQEGTALYCPLCSVVYSEGGDSSLPSPLFGFMFSFVWRLGEGTMSEPRPTHPRWEGRG